MNKMASVRIWAKLTDCDVIVPSETWLKSSNTNNRINIEGYTVFRTDRVNNGGGVAIYAISSLNCSCVESITNPQTTKHFELLVVKLQLPNGADFTVVRRCLPSALLEAATTLMDHLLKLSNKELILMGDLNWDWLS